MTKACVFSLKSDSSRPRHCEIVIERERERESERGRERGEERGTREIKCLRASTHHRPGRKYTSIYIFFWGWKSTQLRHHEKNISVSMCVRSRRMTNERTAYIIRTVQKYGKILVLIRIMRQRNLVEKPEENKSSPWFWKVTFLHARVPFLSSYFPARRLIIIVTFAQRGFSYHLPPPLSLSLSLPLSLSLSLPPSLPPSFTISSDWK